MPSRALLALFVLFMTAASAAAEDIDAALTSESFAGPQGFQELCQREPDFCIAREPMPKLAHTERLQQLLADVQRRVNAGIQSVVEPFGQDDWRTLPPAGDCEDYALSKYVILREAGLAASDMRFAVTLTETGEYHAVLIVDTEHASIVLDNRFDTPMAWNLLREGGYRWIAAQRRGQPTEWSLTSFGQQFAASLHGGTPTSADGR